ncbi:MAG: HPF/RaiA family ribosome-associated protein [Bauldia sp.]
MQTRPQIDFHQMAPNPATITRIEDHIGRLEKRFGRITACRVVVTGPGGRHQNGGLYEVHVDLTLPRGLRVAVNRLNQGDERRADIDFAIDNAFKRARRQLLDRARRLQGATKHHESASRVPAEAEQ